MTKNIDPFFEHLALIEDAQNMIEHSKNRLYELKGRLEAEMDKEERERFNLTLSRQLKIDGNNLRKELLEIIKTLDENGNA